ncbi:MAG: tRNA pseudouridine(55) synthase TruB [Lawsonibacter sp.]|nr:tRNA pseudouridine(55) synthase TruB [Lawsonibacter sp.]
MPSGILIIDKPAGWTSMDVCAKLRGVFHERRVGHSGTLDPMATGVLPIFIGRATRAVEFAEKSDKEYIAGLKLGVITNTQDTSGEVLEERPVSVTREQLEGALERFRGDILQIPPMFSAIKINGKKLYELARKGREVERPARLVTIKALELLDQQGEDLYTIRVRCTKGTYIRTLCHDIGQALGCGGCMASLRRTEAAGFTLENAGPCGASPLDQVLQMEHPESLLLPVDYALRDLPEVVIRGRSVFQARNGAPVPFEPPLDCTCTWSDGGLCRVYDGSSPQKEFLLVGRFTGKEIKTVKNFFEV